ncbi:MAG: polymer-forming cytoskeletal protein [Acidobacteriota bacterium]|nr:polymer-forming cytoskeletal protein [Acidobacteriota bacterium]
MSLISGREKPNFEVGEVGKLGTTASIEQGTEMEGKLKISAGTARINSRFKGEISGEGALLIADQGEVEAEINVRSATVMGKVKGTLHASERIEIRERGVILGDIYTPILVVEPGGYLDGQCHMPVQPASAPQPELATGKAASSAGGHPA